MAQETAEPDRQSRSEPRARLAAHARLILGLVIIATFLDVVDFSVVQVALPTIRTEFLASLADSQWIIGAYGLTMAGFLMVSGRAGDLYGQKKVFVFGISLFTITSLTAGFAPSLLVLVASRAVQGVGAAITTATAFAILAATFPEGKERNRAIGVIVAVLSAGFAAGSIAGGVLTAAFGWRSVMFVNVPIGTAAALLARRFIVAEPGRAEVKRLDVPGAVLVTVGLILLIYGFTVASEVGFFTLQTGLPIGLSLVVLSVFLAVELRSEAPLIPLAFLRRGSILAANVLGLILSACVGGLAFLLTIYVQEVLRFSVFYAGIAFLPGALMFFFVGGWGSSRLVTRIGLRPVLVISAAMIALGSALLVPIQVAAGYLGILPGFLAWSFGASLGFPAIAVAGLAGTKPGEEGLASGLIQTSSRVGFPLGLAGLLTVAAAFDPRLGVDGFRYAFLGSAVLGALALVIALFFRGARIPMVEVEVVATVAHVPSGRREE